MFGSTFTRPELVGQINPFPIATDDGSSPVPASCGGTVAKKSRDVQARPQRRRRQAATSTSSAVATATPVILPDVVIITSEVDGKGKGQNTYTVTATSSQTTAPLPILIITGTGAESALGALQMISLGGGKYTITVEVRDTGSALATITVTSSYGGSQTIAV